LQILLDDLLHNMKGLGSPAHELRARATTSNIRIGRLCKDNALQSERDQARTFNGTMKVGTKCVDLEAVKEAIGESEGRIEVWRTKELQREERTNT
jgi:hypothetical protein